MNLSSGKARTLSVVAFILSLFIFVFMLIYGTMTGVLAIFLLSWHVFSGLLVWLVLLIQFYQRTLAEQEKLDMSQLSKSSPESTIFSGDGNRMAMLAVAQKRLVFLEKWILPISSVLIAVYQVLMGLWLLRGFVLDQNRLKQDWSDPTHLFLGAVLLAAISFICFLFSRFATGMSVETSWKPLRAGGSYLLATAIFGFALAISMVLAQYKYLEGVTVLNYILPVLIIVLGIETLLNAVLDIYRPRVAGQYSRVAFDSRILGIINEPGGILHTVAHTIDYQFGFKVSQTWFYKLLEKAILPLILFALLVLYLMSSFFVVGPGEAAVVEHLGEAKEGVLPPGLHVKWPWPVEKVYVYPAERIQHLTVGYRKGTEEEKKAVLWGEKHFEEEYDLLVAVETDQHLQDERGVPVSIVQANVPVQYRISNLHDYLYKHANASMMLESICYRELTRFAGSAKIETEGADSEKSQESLLGAGRFEATEQLKERIQKAANDVELGVEIVFLGLQGVHPPAEVAKEYEAVVAAVQQKQATILNAQAEQNEILISLVGSIQDMDNLYELATAFRDAELSGDAQKSAEIGKQLTEAIANSGGDVFEIIRKAQSEAYERVNLAKGEGLRFAGQLQSYQASPEIYKKLQRLIMLEEALLGIRKYVVVTGAEKTKIYEVDLQEKLKTSIYDAFEDLEEKNE